MRLGAKLSNLNSLCCHNLSKSRKDLCLVSSGAEIPAIHVCQRESKTSKIDPPREKDMLVDCRTLDKPSFVQMDGLDGVTQCALRGAHLHLCGDLVIGSNRRRNSDSPFLISFDIVLFVSTILRPLNTTPKLQCKRPPHGEAQQAQT